MKQNLLLLLFVCSFFLSCGVSDEEQNKMATRLYVTLMNEFDKQNTFTDMFLNVNLKSLEHEPFYPLEKGYNGQFSCSFEDGENKVQMYGIVGFDENGFVAKLPEHYGKDKIAIEIMVILVNSKETPVSQSKYNIPTFY